MTRKIDKRACRKFAMPDLEFNLNEGVLHVESCPYIIRTAVRNISGQRILVLYIYQRESILAGSIKPRWVMFQSRDDFATLSLRENASATWQCSTLDSLDRVGGFDSKCAFYRQQDEARVARFCKCEQCHFSIKPPTMADFRTQGNGAHTEEAACDYRPDEICASAASRPEGFHPP